MTRVLISIPPTLLTAFDQYCSQHQYNRSEGIRAAIRRMTYDTNTTPEVPTDEATHADV